jgi:hypothetical protein
MLLLTIAASCSFALKPRFLKAAGAFLMFDGTIKNGRDKLFNSECCPSQGIRSPFIG